MGKDFSGFYLMKMCRIFFENRNFLVTISEMFPRPVRFRKLTFDLRQFKNFGANLGQQKQNSHRSLVLQKAKLTPTIFFVKTLNKAKDEQESRKETAKSKALFSSSFVI